MPKFPEPTFKRRSWRHEIADLLTGGELTRLRDAVSIQIQAINRLRANAYGIEFDARAKDQELKQASDRIVDQQATIKAQRAALDQISAELTFMIEGDGIAGIKDMRAIRAMTKAPPKKVQTNG